MKQYGGDRLPRVPEHRIHGLGDCKVTVFGTDQSFPLIGGSPAFHHEVSISSTLWNVIEDQDGSILHLNRGSLERRPDTLSFCRCPFVPCLTSIFRPQVARRAVYPAGLQCGISWPRHGYLKHQDPFSRAEHVREGPSFHQFRLGSESDVDLRTSGWRSRDRDQVKANQEKHKTHRISPQLCEPSRSGLSTVR